VSPSQGRRPAPKKPGARAGAGGPSRAVAVRRLGLLAFGGAFAVLFIVIAVVGGIGNPSVASGNVAVIESAPAGTSPITEKEFEHAFELAAAGAGLKAVPKPGEKQYEEVKKSALNSLFDAVWIQGLAEEKGISVTEQEVAAELKKLKKQNFKTEAEYKAFLKKSHYTQADVNSRVKLQVLSTKLQEQIKEEAPKPSAGEISAYYEEAKPVQFTQKATREVRLVLNKDPRKVEAAKAQLEKDSSPKGWKAVAKKYSEDPTTKSTGGLQSSVTEEGIEAPVGAAIFEAPEKQLSGPVKGQRGYYIFEVEGSKAETTQPLKTVESQIKTQLEQQAQQEQFTSLLNSYTTTWRSRTFCASGFLNERCANYKGSGHPATAPPACYEAEPKGKRPEACPAAVSQLVPAMPGSVSLLEPRGKPVAQGPHPAGEGSAEVPELGGAPFTPAPTG
jgi:parvulin-like peptidyl-prolyl isomerase